MFPEHVKAPDRAPPGQSEPTAFFILESAFDSASRSDERLTGVARTFIESLFPELQGHFLAPHLTRCAYAARMGNVGYYPALDEFMRNYPADDPVQLAGDDVAMSGQESAVIAGVKAAARALARC